MSLSVYENSSYSVLDLLSNDLKFYLLEYFVDCGYGWYLPVMATLPDPYSTICAQITSSYYKTKTHIIADLIKGCTKYRHEKLLRWLSAIIPNTYSWFIGTSSVSCELVGELTLFRSLDCIVSAECVSQALRTADKHFVDWYFTKQVMKYVMFDFECINMWLTDACSSGDVEFFKWVSNKIITLCCSSNSSRFKKTVSKDNTLTGMFMNVFEGAGSLATTLWIRDMIRKNRKLPIIACTYESKKMLKYLLSEGVKFDANKCALTCIYYDNPSTFAYILDRYALKLTIQDLLSIACVCGSLKIIDAIIEHGDADMHLISNFLPLSTLEDIVVYSYLSYELLIDIGDNIRHIITYINEDKHRRTKVCIKSILHWCEKNNIPATTSMLLAKLFNNVPMSDDELRKFLTAGTDYGSDIYSSRIKNLIELYLRFGSDTNVLDTLSGKYTGSINYSRVLRNRNPKLLEHILHLIADEARNFSEYASYPLHTLKWFISNGVDLDLDTEIRLTSSSEAIVWMIDTMCQSEPVSDVLDRTLHLLITSHDNDAYLMELLRKYNITNFPPKLWIKAIEIEDTNILKLMYKVQGTIDLALLITHTSLPPKPKVIRWIMEEGILFDQ